MVDPTYTRNTLHPRTDADRGAPLERSFQFAYDADLIMNHSGLGQEAERLDKPMMLVAHGRPRSSFIAEASGGTPIYSYHYAINRDRRYRGVITFWPQHEPYLRVMMPDKPVHVISPPVDLDAWSPNGPATYDFGGCRGEHNVVIADAWRDDVDPYEAVNCFALWARGQKGAKLHIYGQQKRGRGWGALIKRIADDGNMGEWRGWVKGLAHVYRAATMVITPHMIDTRTVREAMACGCPVVRIQDIHLDQSRMAFARTANRARIRTTAESKFNPSRTATELLATIHESRAAA
jgi:glycosyltransferase involved in cell wall biosynthesis